MQDFSMGELSLVKHSNMGEASNEHAVNRRNRLGEIDHGRFEHGRFDHGRTNIVKHGEASNEHVVKLNRRNRLGEIDHGRNDPGRFEHGRSEGGAVGLHGRMGDIIMGDHERRRKHGRAD